MTTREIELLMNRYFDNDLPDSEAEKLFSLLSASQESRMLFAGMKAVYESLLQPPPIESGSFPDGIDQKFALLNFGAARKPLMARRFTISVPSAMLSGLLLFMISFLLLFFINTMQTIWQVDEQKSEADYFKSNTTQMPYYN